MAGQPTQPQALFADSYLMAVWAHDFERWRQHDDALLVRRLQNWLDQTNRKETAAQSSFEQTFFVELWGYSQAGTMDRASGYTLRTQYPIKGAGERGGTGQADLAIGWFDDPQLPAIPQVLCEFKDIRSSLDAPQNRANSRSPVEQCADYLKFARDQHDPHGNQKITPTWGILTDMREFRLYWRARMPGQFQRFVITDLLAPGSKAQQQRFLFARMLHRDWLLDRGNGSPLLQLLSGQRVQEKALEKQFYFEYRAYREHLYKVLLAHNPAYASRPRELVRLTQKLLDRFIFILFCEDMGAHLDYPVNLLRELLIEACGGQFFDPDDNDLWTGKVKRLFACMRDGQPFAGKHINRFNGGLFAENDDLDGLSVPNAVFCLPGQGQTLTGHPLTLLYFSASYNFGLDGDGDRAIGLYTLGRIFEQSITDLEILEAQAANAPSLMKLGKRKTDGVYYTPEWVTAYIVEETLGLRLRELRASLPSSPSAEQIDADHTKTGKFRNKDTLSAHYFSALSAYGDQLRQVRVLDPACGSGAFLIQALTRLVAEHEWLETEKSRVSYAHKQSGLFDLARAYREVLSHNLYGVDVNAESVEITKLALWLHTAVPGKPLSALDSHIVCGNSLVDSSIEQFLGDLTEEQRARINPFDYASAFADVCAAGGFDVVIGNPPYIKLQNMRQVQPEATDYWANARQPDGQPRFRSAQTGNYDIYVLFIEQGLRLLKPTGHLGYIAPSVWAVNEYGEGLRELLAETRQLDRWVDFKDHQIFDEAITYSALQFFTGCPQVNVRLHPAPAGSEDVLGLDWAAVSSVPYEELKPAQAWEFIAENDRMLIEKLRTNCTTLEATCNGIMVGIQTSADSIFHLERLAPGRYRSFADKHHPVEVVIEDALMRPLVSGPEAKRYQSPATQTWLLFPYRLEGDTPKLFTEQEMQEQFPCGWKYLQTHEAALRGRESGKMDKPSWYGYVYPKNLNKQEMPKLIVGQTVPNMRVCFDEQGDCYLNNVRVNGILPKEQNGWFLLGILNGPVADFVFRRTAKTKEGGYFEANKQFIAPLPIPPATPEEQSQVAEAARHLQSLHTELRDKKAQLTTCLAAPQLGNDAKTYAWLFGASVDPEKIAASIAKTMPDLRGAKLKREAKVQAEQALTAQLAGLASRLRPGALTLEQQPGQIHLQADGIRMLTAYVDASESDFIAAQWRHVLRTTNITPGLSARKLLDALLALKACDLEPLRKQMLSLDSDLQSLERDIADAERNLNGLIYRLYDLSAVEIQQVERA